MMSTSSLFNLLAALALHLWLPSLDHQHHPRHRRNHPMGPVGRVPPNFEGRGDQEYLPPQLLQLAVFFSLDLAYSNGRPRRPDNVFSCIVVSELILETH